MASAPVNGALPLFVFQQVFEFGDETLVRFLVVGFVRQHDVAIAVERHSIIGVRQIFRGQPEIERVLRHQIEREARGEFRGSGL